MDHHCPWIANCVGFFNHGHFLRYVLYTWLAAGMAEVLLIGRLAQMIWWPETVKPGAYFFVGLGREMLPIDVRRDSLIHIFSILRPSASLPPPCVDIHDAGEPEGGRNFIVQYYLAGGGLCDAGCAPGSDPAQCAYQLHDH